MTLNRQKSLARFRDEEFDLAVIGAGINGAAVARDAGATASTGGVTAAMIAAPTPASDAKRRLAGGSSMNRIATRRLLAVALGAALIANSGGAHAGAPKARFAYVTSCGDAVVQFKVGRNGLVTPNSPATEGAGSCPAALATIKLKNKRFLFAANANDGTVSQYLIAANGTLSPLTPAAFGLSPEASFTAYITVDPKGRYAYVTDFGPDIVQLKVNPDGTLTTNTPPSVIATGARTVAPLADPSGRFLYVTEFGNNIVLQYKIGSEGTLTPNTPASIDSGGNPRNLAITQSGKFVYVPNLDDGTISQYTRNPDGTLANNSPATFNLPSGAGPIQVVINQKGTYAYATDEYLHVVYQFKINHDGTLAANSPTSVPIATSAELMTLDSGGKFAYVADGFSLLYQFKVNSNGTLSPIPNSSNSIGAGTENGQVLLVPGGL
jgi:6-phosphogluconolactonase (cycloisomerase 2 family)